MTQDATLGVYDRMADDYLKMVARRVSPGLERFIATLPVGARVLDLGCGPGHDAADMAAAGLSVLAVDGAAEMVARAARHPGVETRQAVFDDIPGLGRCAGIWASFSLLHAPKADFPRHLAALRDLCDTGAPLALGMKLGSGAGPDRLGRVYAYYSETELRDHLERARFVPGQALTGTDIGLDGTPAPWILIFAAARA